MSFRANLRKAAAGEEGNSAIETAMVASLFFLVTMGTMDMSRLIYDYNFVGFAAREGSRWACARGVKNAATSSTISAYVKGKAMAVANPSLITVTSTWSPNHNPGSTITVNVSYTFTSLFTFVLSSPITFQSSSQMVISQ